MNFSKRAFLFTVAAIVLFASCRKDELHWASAEKIETGTAGRFNRILMPDSEHIIICGGEKFGEAGVMISTNGGMSWSYSSHPDFGKGLYGAAIAPNGNIYFAGFQNKLLHTSDTGKTYNLLQLHEDRYFIAAAFPTNAHGIIVSTVTNESGAVVHIDTFGNTLNTVEFRAGLNDIRFVDSTTGYLAGYGILLKTTDGGYTWQYLEPYKENFMVVKALDRNTLYTCGWGGSIYRTTDAGNNWDCLRNGNDISKPRYHLQDILMLDTQHGYCVGEDGIVIYTDDGGDHWSEVDKFTSEDLHSIALLPSGQLLVCGDAGTLYRISR